MTIKNKKAFFNYHVEERMEAGIVLTGSEVKSLREGKANLVDSYATVKNGEVWLLKVNISPYPPAAANNHLPTRSRKLLLHAEQIEKINSKLEQEGLTLVPLALYFKQGRAKVELGLCRGKKKYDKRETLKKRETDRAIRRVLKG